MSPQEKKLEREEMLKVKKKNIKKEMRNGEIAGIKMALKIVKKNGMMMEIKNGEMAKEKLDMKNGRNTGKKTHKDH